MKLTLISLSIITLLATAGCAFREDRPPSDLPRHDNVSSGVDHGEYPGDKEHGETMQK